jgi:hypothetical protein
MHNQLIGSQYFSVHALWVVNIGVLWQLPEGFKQYSPADADAASNKQAALQRMEADLKARQDAGADKEAAEDKENALQYELAQQQKQERESEDMAKALADAQEMLRGVRTAFDEAEISPKATAAGANEVIRECCRWLLQNGLAHEGLFRIPGDKEQVRHWLAEFETNPQLTIPDDVSVNTVASLIVESLIKLTEAMEAQDEKIWTSSDGSYDLQTNLSELKKKQKELPKEERVLPDAEWVRSAGPCQAAPRPSDYTTRDSNCHARGCETTAFGNQ